MPKYKLQLAYDGTHYSGWQVQPNATSIQTVVQKALETILREKIPLTGAGRTDAGVHARCQVAHFSTENPVETLLRSLNGLLPKDIRAVDLCQVPNSFHARYSALSKTYRYHLWLSHAHNPFTRLYSTHIPYPLDLELFEKAALHFVGKKDFTSFSNEPDRGAAAKNGVRQLTSLTLIENGPELILEFTGTGFLYKMVRNITGTLIDIARGKTPLEALPEIFAAKDRKKAGAAAPAQGLFLWDIDYGS